MSVVCGSTAEEFFYTTRSTSRNISCLLRVVVVQRSSTIRQGAPYEYILSVTCCSAAQELCHRTRSTIGVYLFCYVW